MPQLSVWTFSDTEGRFEIINMDTQPQVSAGWGTGWMAVMGTLHTPQGRPKGDHSQLEGDTDLPEINLQIKQRKRTHTHNTSPNSMQAFLDNGQANLEQDLPDVDSDGEKQKNVGPKKKRRKDKTEKKAEVERKN